MKRKEFYILKGLIMFICMGTIYSWSVFQKPLITALESTYGTEISSTMASMPYTVFLLAYAFSMPVAGRFIKKISPKIIAGFGSILIGTAWIMAAYADSIYKIIATYGLLGGIGVGIVYGVPMAVVSEWFPEKKGFAVGLTLLGFGLSPFITAPLANKFIENFGVFQAFKILGLSFILILTTLSMTLNFPAQNTKIQNFSTDSKSEFLPSQMLKTRTFYSLWLCFAIGTFSGLMVIGLSGVYAQEIINMSSAKAAIFTSMFAIFNGIGRPLFGFITDKLGTKKAVYISYGLIITASVLSILFAENTIIFFISFSLMWLNLGGWLAIAPTSASNIFGKENYPSNFGILFTAYGIGALCQGFVSGFVKETFNSYVFIFYPIIFLCIIGLIVNTFILREKVKNTALI